MVLPGKQGTLCLLPGGIRTRDQRLSRPTEARKAAMLNRATPPERPKTLNAVSFTFGSQNEIPSPTPFFFLVRVLRVFTAFSYLVILNPLNSPE